MLKIPQIDQIAESRERVSAIEYILQSYLP